jgi:response regulator RpfG family c-di-GMP phosphodiesterase
MSFTTDTDHSKQPSRANMDDSKKTIIIYSPDLNFCFSLSMVFQDRYNVITTTNLGMLEKFVEIYSAHLVLVDADPSQKLMERIDSLKESNRDLPVIILYVYNTKEGTLDRAVRSHVDSVFYKPFEIGAVSKRIDELLAL